MLHSSATRAITLVGSLQELGLPYEVKVWMRTPVMAPKELRAIHPLGKVSGTRCDQSLRQVRVVAEQ
jgi:hypothetical protein